MAKLIRIDDSVHDVVPHDLREGFTLDELHKLIGCDTIDIVPIYDKYGNRTMFRMVVDDNGHVQQRKPNAKATVLYQRGRRAPGNRWTVVGDVLIASAIEVR